MSFVEIDEIPGCEFQGTSFPSISVFDALCSQISIQLL